MGRNETIDVLSDVMGAVRVQAACYGRFELSDPWGIAIGSSEHAVFHFVLDGDCLLTLAGGEAVVVTASDIVALPRGTEHTLVSSMDVEPRPFQEVVGEEPCRTRTFRVGGSGRTTTIVSGCFAFDDHGQNPLIRALPSMIHLKRGVQAIPWLQSTLDFVENEAASVRPGTQTVISRLADVLFIHIVRGYLAELPSDAPGWLAATREPHVGGALNLLHADPARDWTVAELAHEVGLSRSAFSARFAALVGEPPLAYLTRWRMHKAATLLRDSETPLVEIARSVGYGTETGFIKAFKRSQGAAPGAYRRRARRDSARPASSQLASEQSS
jgi:AraC-like DNA-binding protein